MAKKKIDLKLVRCSSPKARLSYPHLFEPQKGFEEGDEEKYGATLLFDKDEDLTELKKRVFNAAVDRFGPKKDWPENFRAPFRDGDKMKDQPGYAGCWVVKCTSKERPMIVDQKLKAVPDERKLDIYGGCFVRADLVAYAYDIKGNRGVSFSIWGIQKIGDGEAFGSRSKPEDVFEAVDMDDSVEAEESDESSLDEMDFG